MPIMNYQKEQLRKQSHSWLLQKNNNNNNTPRNKSNQEGKRPVQGKL